ncbi:MAG TPA: hypothetical protein PKA53_01255 [Sphingobacterium sp.]|nr:hypothetical protein [Sphingobacterium sp.]
MKTIFIKNNILSASILLLCLSLTISCSKKSKNDPEPPEPTCRIIVAGGEGLIFNITYNEEGKISKVTVGSTTRTYEYSGNTAIVRTVNAGTFFSKTIYTLNNNGFVTKKRIEYNETGTDWNNTDFLYNESTQLIRTTVTNSSGDIPTTYTYTWENGNLATVAGRIYEYYTDKPQQPGDFTYFEELFEQDGMRVNNSKNAVKSTTVSETMSITYTTDQDGKITSLTTQRGTSMETINYQYECH